MPIHGDSGMKYDQNSTLQHTLLNLWKLVDFDVYIITSIVRNPFNDILPCHANNKRNKGLDF